MRQAGSIAACQFTTCWEIQSRPPASFATQTQPVKTATNPAGTTRPISGTTIALAETPERPTRWK